MKEPSSVTGGRKSGNLPAGREERCTEKCVVSGGQAAAKSGDEGQSSTLGALDGSCFPKKLGEEARFQWVEKSVEEQREQNSRFLGSIIHEVR